MANFFEQIQVQNKLKFKLLLHQDKFKYHTGIWFLIWNWAFFRKNIAKCAIIFAGIDGENCL
jgi:hypothetical protein